MAAERLIAISETAQEIATTLLKFQGYVTESATEVTALASELLGISAALLELKTASIEPRHARRRELVENDKLVVCGSLEYTFRDVNKFLPGLENPRYSRREAFRGVWRQIDTHFRNESHNSLLTRLEYYKKFLHDLAKIVIGQPPSGEIDDLYERIDSLLQIQDVRLANDLENLTLGAPRQQRSWERVRRQGPDHASAGLATPNRPTYRDYIHSPMPADRDGYGFPPGVPMVPGSPSTTTATASTQSSSGGSAISDHWLPSVFKQSRPTTTFKTSGTESHCFGEAMPGASSRLKPDYDELLYLPFEPSGFLQVRIYIRPTDRRGRLLCKMNRNGRRMQSCHPITSLRVLRKDSCLQVCRVDSRRRLVLWANLRFTSYERLILFYCSFLALKAQDEANPIRQLDDHFLEGEVPIFSGIIIDDNYQHALQVFKDEDSGGMRLQAAALRGPLKKCPIWTAFINYRVPSAKWIRQVEPRKIHLGDLTRYIFSHDYVPQLGPNGEHELYFADPSDAEAFMFAIEDLAEHRI